MKKKIGVLLSGCGVKDGSEIHEATLTLYFLDKIGVQACCLAPDGRQLDVIIHHTEQPAEESRSILAESARIARGKIESLSDFLYNDLDGLIIPGGFGATKNLCDYAVKGRQAQIRPKVKNLILAMQAAGKPVAGICIAPVVLALAFKEEPNHPVLTIGNDAGTAADIEFFGSIHQDAAVDEIVIDEKMNIISTPAYMLGPGIADIGKGIEKLVRAVADR